MASNRPLPPEIGSRLGEVAAFCRQNGIARMALFGSTLRGENGLDSDLDLLVEFEKGRTPGFRFFELQDELSMIFGKTVDLETPGFLAPDVRARVVAEARVLYAA
jgi:predicted nucleotidyltransferase